MTLLSGVLELVLVVIATGLYASSHLKWAIEELI